MKICHWPIMYKNCVCTGELAVTQAGLYVSNDIEITGTYFMKFYSLQA